MKRVVDLEAGIAMVVTDLHGDWDAYQRYRDKFLALRANGRADYLILTGDLIHHEGDEADDRSLEMVLDVLALRREIGDQLIYLLGNHELPHIYSITLAKGKHLYTPRFEKAMGPQRSEIMTLFESLPFYIRTKAGVTLCHAGAAAELITEHAVTTLFNFSHQAIWQKGLDMLGEQERPYFRRAFAKLSQQPYDDIVYEYFGITNPDDPRYDDFLIGTLATSSHPDFELLWQALFTINEKEYEASTYQIIVQAMLRLFSQDYFQQTVLVSGHLNCPKGHTVVNNQQLRLASAKHALPRESGKYLLFDVDKEVKTAADLLPQLASVFS